MKYLLLVSVLLSLAATAQVRISAGAGLVATEKGPKINGILNAGYDFKGVFVMTDMRSALYQNQVYLGLHAGYSIQVDEAAVFRPYVGYWRRYSGKNASQDRYVKDGQTVVLSTTPAENLNGHDWGYGTQFITGPWFIDISHAGQWQISGGLTYRF